MAIWPAIATQVCVGLEPTNQSAVATIPVGRGPQGVGVDSVANLVYVADAFDSSVSVIDGQTNIVVATVPVGRGPEGVGVNPTLRRIYVCQQWERHRRGH
jgi:YVTN family beta-propeller protein